MATQKIRQDINIGKNIRILRKKAGYTQEQTIAKLQLMGIEITRSIYSQIECGTYNIKVTELIALAKLLDTDINSFFVDQ
ncbi:MAG: helix-turn-helix transcriptional regulator [Lachnospiraceae bacterium]|nr:helix-turn-helix transcriptional regulator [Lachnospiraceae bacterium]